MVLTTLHKAFKICRRKEENIDEIQKFCNICIPVVLRCLHHVIEAVQAVEGTRCAWYYHGS